MNHSNEKIRRKNRGKISGLASLGLKNVVWELLLHYCLSAFWPTATEQPQLHLPNHWGKYEPAQTGCNMCFCRHFLGSLHICGHALLMKFMHFPSLFFALILPPNAHSFLPFLRLPSTPCSSSSTDSCYQMFTLNRVWSSNLPASKVTLLTWIPAPVM